MIGFKRRRIALLPRIAAVDKRRQGRDLLLHEEHIVQENLENVEIASVNPCLVEQIVKVIVAHQDIGVFAHVAVCMSLDDTLHRSTGIKFLSPHDNQLHKS